MPPVDPGADPTIGAGFGETPEGTEEYSQSAGYSNEDLRARLMCDFIQMAFACDQSRVAAVRLSMDQSRVNLFPITGAEDNFHASSHGGVNATEHADAVGWHVEQFGRMVKRCATHRRSTARRCSITRWS